MSRVGAGLRTFFRPSLAALGVLLMVATSAGAYILRGPHLLDLMVQHIGRPHSLLVVQRVVYHDSRLETGAVEARETVRYVFPGTFRSDSRSPNAERIHVKTPGDSLVVVDGRIGVSDEYPFDRYQDILLYRSRRLLEDHLARLGVDIDATGFERFEDGIVLVLGTEKPDARVNQVWFDKETFRPVRWMMPGHDAEGNECVCDIRYGDWRQVNSAWYPMHIRFYQDDRLVREIGVEQMKVDPEFSKELFDVARLRNEYRTEAVETEKERVSDELNEVQETIDEFRKKFE